jgi:hypothetical protein
MCTAEEVVRTAQVGGPAADVTGWISTGVWTLVGEARPAARHAFDCSGWTSATMQGTGALGTWSSSPELPYEASFGECSEVHPIACCD